VQTTVAGAKIPGAKLASMTIKDGATSLSLVNNRRQPRGETEVGIREGTEVGIREGTEVRYERKMTSDSRKQSRGEVAYKRH
jgi:hypothetical protein